jgi:hypothetical protein
MRVPLLLLLLAAGLGSPVLGQRASTEFASLRPLPFEPAESLPATLSHLNAPAAEGKDHTIGGFLIGAGLGMAAGWLMYNAFCEAVNDQCSDSRMRLVVIGGAMGGALGALIGSLSE